MKRSLSLIGCGLLVVALGSVGCSKKSNSTPPDSGTAGSSAGGSSGGGAGKSGAGGGTAGTKADAGGTLTAAECTTMTVAKSVPMACASCVCTKNTTAAVACLKNADCWTLISCVGSMCAGNGSDIACLSAKCMSSLTGGGATAQAVMIPTMCATECGSSMGMMDAGSTGHDAGN